MQSTIHVYEVRPRKDKHYFDLISDALPFGRLWYDTPDHAIGYAMHSSRSHDAVIRVYDAAGNVIQAHKHAGQRPPTVFPCVPFALSEPAQHKHTQY